MKTFIPWIVTKTESILDSVPWLTVSRQSVTLPNGLSIPDYITSYTRETVIIIPVTSDRRILLVRQYKHGLGRIVVEFPGGFLRDPVEDPFICAQRELLEETGHISHQWRFLGAIYRDPTRGRSVIDFFLAQNCERVADIQPDETEDIELFFASSQEVRQMFNDGRMPIIYCLAAWALAEPLLEKR